MIKPVRNNYLHVEAIIKFFGIAIPANSDKLPVSEDKYKKFMELGMRSGYIVHPACCTDEVYLFLKNQTFNPNATFWKTWEDIKSRSQVELWMHAAFHYFTTYGTDYSIPSYVPNDIVPDALFSKLKSIKPASEQTIAEKCYAMLQSGIALDSDNVQVFCDFIYNTVERQEMIIDIDTIKNREAICILGMMLNTYSKDPVTFVRQLVYAATQNPMLIKSREAIANIGDGSSHVIFKDFTDEQLKTLSTVFYRFKPLFLAFKRNPYNCAAINKIRRYAKKYHKPMATGIFESIMDSKWSDADVMAACRKETNIFKLLRLYAYLKSEMHLQNGNEYKKMFAIRNGKAWTRTYTANADKNMNEAITTLLSRLEIIEHRIYAMVSKYLETTDKKNVRLPKNFILACPISEKNFIGDVPLGSYYEMSTHNFFGVYWRNEWGTHDYDLHFLNKDIHVGWNSNYKNDAHTLLFSGDMTNANPEAVEMFYCKKECPNGIIKLCRFDGEDGSQARMFFGSEQIGKLSHNYMVNPNNIQFKADIFPKNQETTVGAIIDNKVYFLSSETGNGRVPVGYDEFDGFKYKADSYMELGKLLKISGFHIISDEDTETIPDYDFTDFTKDQLIGLFNDIMAANA